MQQRGTNGTRQRESLARNTRGSVGKEYLVAALLVGLTGLGGMRHLGLASGEAVAGQAHGSQSSSRAGAMAVTRMAGKAQSHAADGTATNGIGFGDTATKSEAAEGGVLHTLWSYARTVWNVGDGARRQVNDVVFGGVALVKNAGWNFLWEDTLRGGYRTFAGKKGGWTFGDNPIASILNAVIKTPASLGHTAGDMLHQFSLCANLVNGQDAHGRGQACGRTAVNGFALLSGGAAARDAIVGWRSTAAVATSEGTAAASATVGSSARIFAGSLLKSPRNLIWIPAYNPGRGHRFANYVFENYLLAPSLRTKNK